MDRVVNFNTINDYNQFNNNETLHPLVSIVDHTKADPRAAYKMIFNLYCVVLKRVKCGDLKYGNHNYDYQEGTLVFFAPGQVVEVVSDEVFQPSGLALAFHPDLLVNTPLGKRMNEFGFFGYNTNEALHLSDKEKSSLRNVLKKYIMSYNNPLTNTAKCSLLLILNCF